MEGLMVDKLITRIIDDFDEYKFSSVNDEIVRSQRLYDEIMEIREKNSNVVEHAVMMYFSVLVCLYISGCLQIHYWAFAYKALWEMVHGL